MLQAANLLLHMAHMSGHRQISQLFDMITVNSAKTLCEEDNYGIEVGKPADIVIIDASDEAEAVRLVCDCLYVIRRGKVVCQTTPAKRILSRYNTEERIDFKI